MGKEKYLEKNMRWSRYKKYWWKNFRHYRRFKRNIRIWNRIRNCQDKEISNLFNRFMNCNSFIDCEEYKDNKFCVSRKIKRRYINPLTKSGRVYDVSKQAKKNGVKEL